jgi:hypothetical protein
LTRNPHLATALVVVPVFLAREVKQLSLTSFLKQSKEIRLELRQHFPYPLKSVVFPHVQAPPLTTNYAMVGQAFDYLLRFYMQRHNPHASDAAGRSHWIADSMKVLAGSLVGESDEIQRQREAEALCPTLLESAHAHHERYLENGLVTDELLGSCLNLAIMDGIVRAGELRAELGVANPRDIQDLRNLLALVPAAPFLDGQKIFLNPPFRFPSGADCDLLIDDTLIEIKTTKFSEVKEEYYQQLLGYHLCTLPRSGPRGFQRIGVYFSRHGFLWSVALSDIASEDAFCRFLPRWGEHVTRYHEARPCRKPAPAPKPDALIAQVDKLGSVAHYTSWLAQLSDADFTAWKAYSPASSYAMGAIEAEQERRERGVD